LHALPRHDKLKDGLYIIKRFGNNRLSIGTAGEDERVIKFNSKFFRKNPQVFRLYVIDTRQFVPLHLKKNPESVVHEDKGKKIFLTLNDKETIHLKKFTSENIGKSTALVIAGKAVSINTVNSIISGGQLQILNCTDNACHFIYRKAKRGKKKE
jgi:preprotein translocase subunit SecD